MSFQRIHEVQLADHEIAVALMPSTFGSHIGLLFHSAKHGLQLLHLAWHRNLKVDQLHVLRDCWIVKLTKLPPSASRQVVGICRSIAAKKPNINYGINAVLARGSISPNGLYRAPKGSDGMTCATFVLETFRGASIRLLDERTWPDTEENRTWGAKVVDCLKTTGVEPAHIEAVRKNISGLRIRPEEVAAGATLKGRLQLPFEVVSVEAKEIQQQLTTLCPRTPAILAPTPPTMH